MVDINKLIRSNIKDLKSYSSARDEFNGTEGIFLDANESPYGRLNRYPDPHHTQLRQKIGEIKKFDPSNIFIGNGSDEIIDLVFRIFCTPGKDRALTFNPTYGMYEVAAAINDAELLKIDLDDNFQVDLNTLMPLLSDAALKLIIICSPNNPTGNQIKNIDLIIKSFDGIVLVDEAYIDFAEGDSLIEMTAIHENLIVCQTFSKALGIAGARVGVAYARKSIIDIFYRVKPPYNTSSLNQRAALEVLDNYDMILRRIEKIVDERRKLKRELEKLNIVRKVWPSDSNFLLVEFERADEVFSNLRSQNIIVRNRTGQVKDSLRITTGTPSENIRLLNALRKIEDATYLSSVSESNGIEGNGSSRSVRIVRSTSETNIVIDLTLDGEGMSDINTGIGFFDHMLCQVAIHGGYDLDISVSGDLNVDEHHTIEDVALALGEAFDKALGNRRGIERFGFLLPMDDSLAQVAVDFGGRPYLVWDVSFERKVIGEMPSEMISHFFRSFAEKARCNLNIKAGGGNEHHKAEAIFKAFARATRMAVRRNECIGVPSTKGIL